MPKIVDLAHSLFNKFFAVLHDISFAEEARRTSIIPVVLFLADTDLRSRQGFDMLRDCFPRFVLVPVFNHALPSIMRHLALFSSRRRIDLFCTFARAQGARLTARTSRSPRWPAPLLICPELYLWTRRLFLEFRE